MSPRPDRVLVLNERDPRHPKAGGAEVHVAEIFRRLCSAHQLDLPNEVLRYLFDQFYPETGVHISCAHPRFLLDSILERRLDQRPEHAEPDTPELALEHDNIRGPAYYH